jgi:hypothetical protein
MGINSKKSGKFSEGFGQHLNVFLKPSALKKHQDASAECNHSRFFIWFGKPNKDFSYTIFPVKKINVGQV